MTRYPLIEVNELESTNYEGDALALVDVYNNNKILLCSDNLPENIIMSADLKGFIDLLNEQEERLFEN